MPELFNEADEFDKIFDNMGDNSKKDETIKNLHKILKPFLLRRIKSDVEKQLLPKKEIYIFCGMSELQRIWYRNILKNNYEFLSAHSDKTRLMNILMHLKKVCNHPYLFDGAEHGPPYIDGPHLWENCEKMRVLDLLLSKFYKRGNKVLIFSTMVRILDILDD